MREETRKRIEEELSGFPICEYAFLRTEELPFSEKVRYICRTECPRYGKSWACPPAAGSVEECRKRCLVFEGGFLFTTVSEGADLENMEERMASFLEEAGQSGAMMPAESAEDEEFVPGGSPVKSLKSRRK